MALNITVSGDVYDKDGNKIDCHYQIYYPDYDVLTDVKDTQSQQYSFNLGDDDGLTNDGSVHDGAIIYVMFWTGDSRDTLQDMFSALTLIYDGADYYVIDSQLIPSQPPAGSITVYDSTINTEVVVNYTADDYYTWVYDDSNFEHIYGKYGISIFDSVGIDTVEYKYEDEYISDNTHTFTETGVYTISVKITNKYGQEVIVSKDITIKNNAPTITLSVDNNNPEIFEEITLAIDISDPDDTITESKLYIDDVETTESTFSWDSLTHYHTFKYEYTYDDSVDTITKYEYLTINMKNLNPEINTTIDNTGNVYTIDANITDYEDLIDNVKYTIYLCMNSIFEEEPDNCNWVLLDTKTITEEDYSTNIIFHRGGIFKVEVVGYDTWGYASNTDTVQFEVNSEVVSNTNTEQVVWIEWE